MTADFRLVANAAEGNPQELAPHRPRYGTAERGFADAGRAHEAEDRPLDLLHQSLHGEVFEDALLDLLQAVMIRFEDLFRLIDIDLVARSLPPGQGHQPIDVIAYHGGFR